MTRMTIESDGESITRFYTDDSLTAWQDFVPIFFEMLQGLGYSFPFEPYEAVSILWKEDAE
jgi:hypothetical protein